MFDLNMIIGWETSHWVLASFIILIFEILHINHMEDNKVFAEQQTILELKNYAFIPFHLFVIGEKMVHWSRIKPSRHVWQGQTFNVKGKSHILPSFILWVCAVCFLMDILCGKRQMISVSLILPLLLYLLTTIKQEHNEMQQNKIWQSLYCNVPFYSTWVSKY